jgi:hypothetical protein
MLLFLLLGLLAGVTHAIPTITAKGAKFFTSDGNQFFLKGLLFSSASVMLATNHPHKASPTNSCRTTLSSTMTNALAMQT